MLTGYVEKLDKIQVKIDKVPYEKFPFCCSNARWDFDADLSKKPIRKIRKPTPEPIKVEAPPQKIAYHQPQY